MRTFSKHSPARGPPERPKPGPKPGPSPGPSPSPSLGPSRAQGGPKLGPGQISGNLKIWDLEIWKFGIQKIKNKNSQNQNPFCPKCREYFLSRKKMFPAPFGALPAHFFHGPEKSKKSKKMSIFLGLGRCLESADYSAAHISILTHCEATLCNGLTSSVSLMCLI